MLFKAKNSEGLQQKSLFFYSCPTQNWLSSYEDTLVTRAVAVAAATTQQQHL